MNVSTVARTPYERLLLQFTPRAIRSRTQYQRVLRQVDRLMREPKLTRAEDDLLELLASLVAQYEQTRFPAPDVTPAEAVKKLGQAPSQPPVSHGFRVSCSEPVPFFHSPAAMLAHLLEARGATVEDVAAATAIPKRTLAKFLDGSQPIDATSRAQLAKFFHVSADVFLTNEDS
jgi:antitoxin component HigA of HigAB toxin-antitoxin module